MTNFMTIKCVLKLKKYVCVILRFLRNIIMTLLTNVIMSFVEE